MKTTESFIVCFQHLCLAAESIDFLFSHRREGQTNRKKSKNSNEKRNTKTKRKKVQKCGKGIFESQNTVKLQNTTLGIIVSSIRCKTKSIFANICYMHTCRV